MICTFIDSGVLIAAARGEGAIAQRALEILADSNREFASSIFLKLEVLPKAVYNNRTSEVKFYEEYFDAVVSMDLLLTVQPKVESGCRCIILFDRNSFRR